MRAAPRFPDGSTLWSAVAPHCSFSSRQVVMGGDYGLTLVPLLQRPRLPGNTAATNTDVKYAFKYMAGVESESVMRLTTSCHVVFSNGTLLTELCDFITLFFTSIWDADPSQGQTSSAINAKAAALLLHPFSCSLGLHFSFHFRHSSVLHGLPSFLSEQ